MNANGDGFAELLGQGRPEVAEAFVEIDRLAEQMKRTGVTPDSVELLVVDEERRVIRRRVN